MLLLKIMNVIKWHAKTMKNRLMLLFSSLLFSLDLSINNDGLYALNPSLHENTEFDCVSEEELRDITNTSIKECIEKSKSQWAKDAITSGNKHTSSINNLIKLIEKNFFIKQEIHEKRVAQFCDAIKRVSNSKRREDCTSRVLSLSNGLLIDISLMNYLNCTVEYNNLNEFYDNMFSEFSRALISFKCFDIVSNSVQNFLGVESCTNLKDYFRHDWDCYLNQFRLLNTGKKTKKEGEGLEDEWTEETDLQVCIGNRVLYQQIANDINKNFLPSLGYDTKLVKVTPSLDFCVNVDNKTLNSSDIRRIDFEVREYIYEKRKLNTGILEFIRESIPDVLSRPYNCIQTKDGYFIIVTLPEKFAKQDSALDSLKKFSIRIMEDLNNRKIDTEYRDENFQVVTPYILYPKIERPKLVTEQDKIKYLEQKLSEKAKTLKVNGTIKVITNKNEFSFLSWEGKLFVRHTNLHIKITDNNGQDKFVKFRNASLSELILIQYLQLLEDNNFSDISDYEFDLICQGCARMKMKPIFSKNNSDEQLFTFKRKKENDNFNTDSSKQSQFSVEQNDNSPKFAFGIDDKRLILDLKNPSSEASDVRRSFNEEIVIPVIETVIDNLNAEINDDWLAEFKIPEETVLIGIKYIQPESFSRDYPVSILGNFVFDVQIFYNENMTNNEIYDIYLKIMELCNKVYAYFGKNVGVTTNIFWEKCI